MALRGARAPILMNSSAALAKVDMLLHRLWGVSVPSGLLCACIIGVLTQLLGDFEASVQ